MMKVPLAMPVIDKEMVEAATHALQNEKLVMGESVFKFEEDFAKYIGTKEAVSTNSGTMALFLAVIGANMEKNKKVIAPAFTFIATSNSIIHANRTPALVDISLNNYILDPAQTENRIKIGDIGALMPVHLYGHPAEMDEFLALKEKYGVKIIEDCAQAHGALYRNARVGSIGDFGAFSFYSIKNMTVGGDGGMVTLNDEEIAEKLRSIRDCGRKTKYEHTYVGYTARLNTINAAIGRVQLKKLDLWNERRRQIATIYRKKMKDVEEIVLPPDDKNTKSVYHLFVIRTKNGDRDKLMNYLSNNGIGVGIHYPIPNHLQPIYKELFTYNKGDFPNSELAADNVLSLPMHPLMNDEEAKYVSEKVREYYGR